MSDGMLEVRKTFRANGNVEFTYRIGTREWVDITSLEHSVYAEQEDGSFLPADQKNMKAHFMGRWSESLGLRWQA